MKLKSLFGLLGLGLVLLLPALPAFGQKTGNWTTDYSNDETFADTDVLIYQVSPYLGAGLTKHTTWLGMKTDLWDSPTITGALTIDSSLAIPFKVEGSHATASTALIGNTGTGAAQVVLDASNGDGAGADYMILRQNNSLVGDIYTSASSNAAIHLWADSDTTTNQVVLKPGGNVGFGVADPNARVDVATPASGSTVKLGRGAASSSIIAGADASGGILALDGASGGDIYLNNYGTGNVVSGGEVRVVNDTPTVAVGHSGGSANAVNSGTIDLFERVSGSGNSVTDAGNNGLRIRYNGSTNTVEIGTSLLGVLGSVVTWTRDGRIPTLAAGAVTMTNVASAPTNPGGSATVYAQAGNVVTSGPLKPPTYTVAGLPAAGTVGFGAMAFVSDSSVVHAGNSGAIVAGGGANFVPVYSNNVNWRIH